MICSQIRDVATFGFRQIHFFAVNLSAKCMWVHDIKTILLAQQIVMDTFAICLANDDRLSRYIMIPGVRKTFSVFRALCEDAVVMLAATMTLHVI